LKLIQTVNHLKIKEHKGEYLVFNIRKELMYTGESLQDAIGFCLDSPKRLAEIYKNLDLEPYEHKGEKE
jgi:hypothetical protein